MWLFQPIHGVCAFSVDCSFRTFIRYSCLAFTNKDQGFFWSRLGASIVGQLAISLGVAPVGSSFSWLTSFTQSFLNHVLEERYAFAYAIPSATVAKLEDKQPGANWCGSHSADVRPCGGSIKKRFRGGCKMNRAAPRLYYNMVVRLYYSIMDYPVAS